MEAPLGSLSLPMARSTSPSPLWFPALQDEYFYASNAPSPSSSASSLSEYPMLSAATLSAHHQQFRRRSGGGRLRSPLDERSSERIVERLPSFLERDGSLASSHLGLSRVASHDTMATARTVASADAAAAQRGRRAPRRSSHRAMSAQDFESIIKQVYSGDCGDVDDLGLGSSGKR